jgi:hypothetical protein
LFGWFIGTMAQSDSFIPYNMPVLIPAHPSWTSRVRSRLPL